MTIIKIVVCLLIIAIFSTIVFAPMIIVLSRLLKVNHSDQINVDDLTIRSFRSPSSSNRIVDYVKKEASKQIEFFLARDFYFHDVAVLFDNSSKEIRYALKYQDEVDQDHRIVLYREEILEIEDLGQVNLIEALLISSVTAQDFKSTIKDLDLDKFYQETIARKYEFSGIDCSSLEEIRNSMNLVD